MKQKTHLNTSDYLTGLSNRQGLCEYYDMLDADTKVHFMFMDLDNFKAVNDVYGHSTGDELLRAMGLSLMKIANEAFGVRLGGDEFVLVFTGDYTVEKLCEIANKIIQEVKSRRFFPDVVTSISVSIGIVDNENRATSLNEMLLKSDMAMYSAKTAGKNCYIIYRDIEDKIQEETEIGKRQEQALLNHEFIIYYLPVIRSQTSELFLSKVYVTWEDGRGRVRGPELYMPVLEKNGFVRRLDLHIFERICVQLHDLYTGNQSIGKVSICLSAFSLLEEDLPETLCALIRNYDLDSSHFDISANEAVLSTRNSQQIIQMMIRLKEKGFSISLENFGADFSGLKYLQQLPLDTLQFNADYLKEALSNRRGHQILKMLLIMGKDLKYELVAIGIESKNDIIFLNSCGCNAISGSYFSAPIPAEKYVEYAEGKLPKGERSSIFRFFSNLLSDDKNFQGRIIGTGVDYCDGISDDWGGLIFSGGEVMENIVELPEEMISGKSYTFCFWLKPQALTAWTSAVYSRFSGGFSSYVPSTASGESTFRISEDADANGWYDLFGRQLFIDKWYFVAMTYDSFSESMRYLLNGRTIGYRVDVPDIMPCRQILLGGDPFQKSYKGILSGLIIYESAKSAQEINEIYKRFLKEAGFRGSFEEFWKEYVD